MAKSDGERHAFAIISQTGRLVINEPTKADNNLDITALPENNSSVRNTKPQEWADARPSLGVGRWLDYYQAAGLSQAALGKLKARRKTSLKIVQDDVAASPLENSMLWLEKVAGAVTMLQEMRKEHTASLKQDSILPVGRLPSGLLAEWSGSEAVDILAEALPKLVDQVDLYEESITSRGQGKEELQELRTEMTKLRDELKGERRQREYYWRKLREMQQSNRTGDLGVEAKEVESDGDNDIPMFSAKDMKELRRKFLKQLEDLENQWQERFDAEKRRALDEKLRLEAEIRALRAQLEDALQGRNTGYPHSSQNTGDHWGGGDTDISQGAAAGFNGVAGSTLPGIASKVGQGSSSPGSKGAGGAGQGAGQGAGLRGRSGDTPGFDPVDGGPSGQAGGNMRQNGFSGGLRSPSNDSAGLPGSGPGSSLAGTGPSGTRETSPEANNSQLKGSRPGTAKGLSSQQEEDNQGFTAKSFNAGPSKEDQRRMAEELKRRVFESVLAEEKKRQEDFDEQDQNATAARMELQGHAELSQLLRRVETLELRRDLFRVLKTYCKRSPMAMEVVCTYCRRKPRPDQIHSFEVPSRPASAGRISSGQSTLTSACNTLNLAAMSQTFGNTTIKTLPRVSSSPSVTMGSLNGTLGFEDATPVDTHAGKAEPRRLRPVSGRPKPKLVAVMPATPGLTPIPGSAPDRQAPAPRSLNSSSQPSQPPVGWASVDAAC